MKYSQQRISCGNHRVRLSQAVRSLFYKDLYSPFLPLLARTHARGTEYTSPPSINRTHARARHKGQMAPLPIAAPKGGVTPPPKRKKPRFQNERGGTFVGIARFVAHLVTLVADARDISPKKPRTHALRHNTSRTVNILKEKG